MSPERLWNKRYIHLLTLETMMQIALYLTRPITSTYAVDLGASITMAGFIAGLLATGALVMRPFSGAFSDLFSKKNLLVVSAALFAAAAFGCYLANSVVMLTICCAVQGFAFAFKSTLIISLVSLVVPKQKVGSGVGWMSIAYTVACAIGPAIGAYIGELFGYSTAFLLSAVMLTIGFILAVTFKEPKDAHARKREEGSKGLLGGLKLSIILKPSKLFEMSTLPFSLIAGLLMIAQGTNNSFMIFLGTQGDLSGAPLYFLVYSIITLVSKPFAGNISDKYGVKSVVSPALIIAIAGMVLLIFNRSIIAVVIAGACMALGQATAYSAIQAESVRGVEPKKLGRAANTFFIGPDLGMGLGPILGGFVYQMGGAPMMFGFNAIMIFSSLIGFLIYQRITRGRPEQVPS